MYCRCSPADSKTAGSMSWAGSDEWGLLRPEELGMGMLEDVTSRLGGEEEGNLN